MRTPGPVFKINTSNMLQTNKIHLIYKYPMAIVIFNKVRVHYYCGIKKVKVCLWLSE